MVAKIAVNFSLFAGFAETGLAFKPVYFTEPGADIAVFKAGVQ